MSFEPLKMAWITDFTLKCLDRDILIVKECFMKISPVFKSMIEANKELTSLHLDLSSENISHIMKVIHAFPSTTETLHMPIKFEEHEKDTIRFCLKYGLNSAIFHIKNQMPACDKAIEWLSFLREFVDANGDKVFQPEINSIMEYIIKKDKIDLYIQMTSNNSSKDSDDHAIMRILNQQLKYAMNRLECLSFELDTRTRELNECQNDLERCSDRRDHDHYYRD